MTSHSPNKSATMLKKIKNKFLTKNRKYEIASGCPEHSTAIDDVSTVTLSRYEVRAKSASLGSPHANRSPKHQPTGVIWHNNTYDILPFQLDTISPSKKNLRQNSLPLRRQAGEELPPLPLKAREGGGDGKKKLTEHEKLLADSLKTPSPTDSIYVCPRPILQQTLVEPPANSKASTSKAKSLDKTDGEKEDKLLPPPNFRDCDEQADDDKEFPSTWLRSPRVKSPNASVSTPSPTDSESKAEDASLTSDNNIEKKPSLKKREKANTGVKPPMMRPLRKKKAPLAPGDKRDSRNLDKEDAPLPPSPAKGKDIDRQSTSTVDSGGGQRDSGLSMASSVFENEPKSATTPKSAEPSEYTSFDELQNHLRATALPAPPVVDTSEVVYNDDPFPPPPPPLAEVFSTSRNIEVTEGEPLKQTIVRPRFKDGLLEYAGTTDEVDGSSGSHGGAQGAQGATARTTSTSLLQDPTQQNVLRNISHESGYETAGIDHSSSSEHIKDDVFPDPVQDLITENLDYGDDEVELRKGPIYHETTEVNPLSPKAVREMYAFVPKSGGAVPRSESNHTDTSTDNYPESPGNTGTSTSVSSPEDDGDRDTLKLSAEVLPPAPLPEAEELVVEDDDYLPPIPTRNYQGDSSNKTIEEEDDDIIPPPTFHDDDDDNFDMISSMHSEMSIESVCASEPVHMSLDEVREQAKTLGVPLSVTNSSVNQSQPCITSKTRSMSDTSTESGPVSPSSKHNTFPSDKSSTPQTTPKKFGTKKKPKLRIPNIFHRGKSSPEPPRCEVHDTIQKRSLPAPPPRKSSAKSSSKKASTSEDDNDKTPVGSPHHQPRSSSSASGGHVSSTCQIHGTLGPPRGASGHQRNMPGREWSTTPRPSSRNQGSDSPNHSMLSLASNHGHSLASSVASINSAVSSSGYATNSNSMSMQHTNSNADFISSLSKLKHVGWYWGPLSWDEAESKINNKPDGSFLVRDSSDDRYILSLSFRSQNLTHHTRIEHYKGMFSFYSQPKSHGASTIIDFIEKAMEHSRNGKFLYFLRPRAPGLPPAPVQLLHPISRFRTLQSLQHICRFEIIKHVRKDHIHLLPIPHKIKDYLLSNQYYIEEYS